MFNYDLSANSVNGGGKANSKKMTKEQIQARIKDIDAEIQSLTESLNFDMTPQEFNDVQQKIARLQNERFQLNAKLQGY